MEIHALDIGIIVAYLVIIVAAGVLMSKRAGRNIESYFLGGKSIPWYLLGIANASGMFDITGTMLMVTWVFVYGLKGAWIPWLWPTFNQVFLMIYLAVWLRRSNVMTGAEWIKTRFGTKAGAEMSHISVVFFAIVGVIGFLAYAFQGIGKFATVFLPWDLSRTLALPGLPPIELTSAHMYAFIFMGITTIYVIMGGMYSVVLTDIIQYAILTIASFFIAGIAISRTSAGDITAAVPQGWKSIFFHWKLDVDWSNLIPSVNNRIAEDGYSLFGIFFMMVLFKGILASVAGPAPNYDMQKILSTRTPKEGAMMSFSTSAVLFFPRYLLISGITVLALVFFSSGLNAMGGQADFEKVLPYVINNFVPVGLKGLVLAGLLAAFMSTFDCTVNCGASYVVNDIYKRYIKRNAPEKQYVYMSYVASILIVIVGVSFGLLTKRIQDVTMWIVAGLYAGYIAPNLLKWHWWRFNGYGYFAGMIAGTLAAIFLSQMQIFLPDLYARFRQQTAYFEFNLALFPILLAFSTAASIIVSLLTPPDDEETLESFYKNVRPWGFWGPVYKKVAAEDPNFEKNRAFARDMVNVAVGMAWQLPLAVIPIFLVIREYKAMWISVAILVVTSIFLKFNWYDKLEPDDRAGRGLGTEVPDERIIDDKLAEQRA
jgi:SSS family solute:Na+ symporter